MRRHRAAGGDPAMEKREAVATKRRPAVESGYTVRQLCDDYLAGHIRKHRAPAGIKETERLFAKRLVTIADKQASALTRAEAFNLLEDQSDTPVSTGQLRGELAAAWDYALDAGRLPESSPNWWRLVMRGRLRSKGKVMGGKHIGVVKRVLTEAEAGALIRWLPHFTGIVDDALTLYLWTCTRGAEICAMEAKEISQEKDGLWWTVPKAKTKNARHALATDLRVPLVGRAAAVVRRRLADYPSGFLFPARDSQGNAHSKQAVVQTQVHYYQPYSRTNLSTVGRAYR